MPIIRSCRLCVRLQHPANRTHNLQLHITPTTCKPKHQVPRQQPLELLMMGLMVPETCWANNKFCNKEPSVASSWPFYFHVQVLVIQMFICFISVVHNLAGTGSAAQRLVWVCAKHHFLFMQCALLCCKHGSSSFPDHSQATVLRVYIRTRAQFSKLHASEPWGSLRVYKEFREHSWIGAMYVAPVHIFYCLRLKKLKPYLATPWRREWGLEV